MTTITATRQVPSAHAPLTWRTYLMTCRDMNNRVVVLTLRALDDNAAAARCRRAGYTPVGMQRL